MQRFAAGVALTLFATAALAGDVVIGRQPGQRVRGPQADSDTLTAWPKYCGSLTMSGEPVGFSNITPATAHNLALAWQVKLSGPIASAPSIFKNRIYIGDWGGMETALDTLTGSVVAQANLGMTNAPQCTPSSLGITSSPAIVGSRLYLAGGDDSFYALDAATLTVIWKEKLGDNSAGGGYYGWSSPAIVGNRIIQGVASNCDTPFVPGRLVALDLDRGLEAASADFIADGKVGNGVWTSPAIDLTSRKIFVTTASGLDYNDGLGYSIIRLNLDTFAIEDSWKLKLDPDNIWDADWGSSPTLFTDGAGRALVGAGHKDGHYYAFDRNNLAAGPVWMADVARTGEVPQDGDGTLSTAAFDGTRLYVGGGIPADNADPLAGGSVVAVDPNNGAILWRQTMPGTVIAPVSTVHGVVFAAGGNLVEAFDGTTGNVLWSYRTAAPIYGGIAIAGDTVYVGDLAGKLYAFRLS
jgi:outer membrane protein assembly factor BamB